jgi:phosphomethylpyrimidine synthase
MKVTEDVRKFAAEQGIAEDVAIEEGLKQKATEFKRSWRRNLREGLML